MIGPTRSSNKSAEEATNKNEEFDRLSGDGLRVKKSVNKDSLWVKGDGCSINFATNIGRLRVSGDGCRVRIGCNLGSVEYSGDGGHIILGGPDSQECIDRVIYKGDGGLIEFNGTRKHVRNNHKDCNAAKTTTNSAAAAGVVDADSRHYSKSFKGDMRTKIVGSNNVHLHFDLRPRDKKA